MSASHDVLPLGVQVRLNDAGLRAWTLPSTRARWRTRVGTIVGYSRKYDAYYVRVPAVRSKRLWAHRYVEVVD